MSKSTIQTWFNKYEVVSAVRISTLEQKLYLKALELLNINESKSNQYKVEINLIDFFEQEQIGIDSKDISDKASNMTEAIMRIVVRENVGEKGWTMFRLLNSCEYHQATKTLVMEFPDGVDMFFMKFKQALPLQRNVLFLPFIDYDKK